MAKLVILGSSNAIPGDNNETTHLAVVEREKIILIDCSGSPVTHLPKAGIQLSQITDIILTHFHPDHVSGIPMLLMTMWLKDRRQPLDIYGLDHTLDRMEALMNFFDWSKWPNFFPVTFHRLSEEEMTLVVEDNEVRVLSSPVCHLIPTIGLRIEFLQSRKAIAYSCDTEPCPQVIRLADKVDILIHDVAGATPGHSSSEQAAEIANQAHAGSLYLIHYDTYSPDHHALIAKAQEVFAGKVALTKDFMVLE